MARASTSSMWILFTQQSARHSGHVKRSPLHSGEHFGKGSTSRRTHPRQRLCPLGQLNASSATPVSSLAPMASQQTGHMFVVAASLFLERCDGLPM